MNKTKKVAWHKHLKRAIKNQEKRKAYKASAAHNNHSHIHNAAIIATFFSYDTLLAKDANNRNMRRPAPTRASVSRKLSS